MWAGIDKDAVYGITQAGHDRAAGPNNVAADKIRVAYRARNERDAVAVGVAVIAADYIARADHIGIGKRSDAYAVTIAAAGAVWNRQ